MKLRLPYWVPIAIAVSPAGSAQAGDPRLLIAAGDAVIWVATLIAAGPAVLVLFHLLTGRPLPAWARARTVWDALKTFFGSRADATAPTLRVDFDVNRFLREAKETFLQVQRCGDAESPGDRETILAPGLRAEVGVRRSATRGDAVEKLQAELLALDTEHLKQVASVRFSAMVGGGADAVPIAQVWEFSRATPTEQWMVTEMEIIDVIAATPMEDSGGQKVYRLAPLVSRHRHAWGSLAIGLLTGGLGFLLLKDAVGQEIQGLGDLLNDDLWIEFLVGGVFCLTGLIALWAVIVALLSGGRQETIVEVAPQRFARGARVSITFRQPGPLSLKSLRANLVGRETWREANDKGWRDLGTHPLLDSGPQEISRAHPYEKTITLQVPRNLSPSGPTAKGREVEWVIEVYGKVSGSVGFAQSFLVQIC